MFEWAKVLEGNSPTFQIFIGTIQERISEGGGAVRTNLKTGMGNEGSKSGRTPSGFVHHRVSKKREPFGGRNQKFMVELEESRAESGEYIASGQRGKGLKSREVARPTELTYPGRIDRERRGKAKGRN